MRSDTIANTIDQELLEQAHTMRQRAISLRAQSGAVGVLGATYRRRASELELEAFVSELQSGLPYDLVQVPAA